MPIPMMGGQAMNPMLMRALMQAQQGGGMPMGGGQMMGGGMPGGAGGPPLPSPMQKPGGGSMMMPNMTAPTMPGAQPGMLQSLMSNPQSMGLLQMLMKNGGFGGIGGGGGLGGGGQG